MAGLSLVSLAFLETSKSRVLLGFLELDDHVLALRASGIWDVTIGLCESSERDDDRATEHSKAYDGQLYLASWQSLKCSKMEESDGLAAKVS